MVKLLIRNAFEVIEKKKIILSKRKFLKLR